MDSAGPGPRGRGRVPRVGNTLPAGRTRASPNPFFSFTKTAPEPAAAESLPLKLALGQCDAGAWYPVIDPFGFANTDLTDHEASVEIKHAVKLFRVIVAASEESAKSPVLNLLADHMKPALAEYERDPDRGSVQIQEVVERFGIYGSFPQLQRVSLEAELPPEVASAAASEVARVRQMAGAQARRYVIVDVQRDTQRYVISPVRCALPPSRSLRV